MNPEDQNYGAGAEAAHQANDVQNQMSIEEEAAKPPVPEVDNSIIAGIEADEDMKSLSDVIHEGATQPDPTPTDFASEPAKPETEKKPGSKKPLIIGIVAVVVLAAAGLGIWALLSAGGGDEGGAKPDPDRTAFFVEGENGNSSYAIYNDKGEKLTDFNYEMLSDFNSAGYAVVKKVGTETPGIMTNIGKYSIAPGKYTSIEAFGAYFAVKGEEGGEILIDGSGKKLLDVESRMATIGLYSVYDGSSSIIYDKDGNKVGESDSKKPLNDVTVSDNNVCMTYDKKVRCYDTKTGNKYAEFDSEEPLTLYLTGSGTVTKHRQCMRLESTDKTNKMLYLYFYGTLYSVEGYKTGALGAYERMASNNCYFTDHKVVFGKDDKAIKIPTDANATRMLIRDSDHYMYYTQGSDKKFAIYLHADGEERAIAKDLPGVPEIDGGNSYYVVYYEHPEMGQVIEYYADGFEPLITKKVGIAGVSYSSPLDENGNFIAYRQIYNKDKEKAIYNVPYEISTASIYYEDGYYFVRGYVLDSEDMNLGLVDKDGKEILKPGKYDSFRKYGKYLVAKKGEAYTLLNIDGKELLEKYDNIKVTDSHIEALLNGKTEYYLLDMTKIK